MKNHLGQTEGLALGAMSMGGALELLSTPFFGNLSDRIGRRRLYVTGAAFMAVIAFPMFLLRNTRNPGLIILGILLVRWRPPSSIGRGLLQRRELPDPARLRAADSATRRRG